MHHEGLRTLYQSEDIWIQRCACGVFHVHVGAVTLRFDQASFEEFFNGLGAAMSHAALWRFAGKSSPKVGTA